MTMTAMTIMRMIHSCGKEGGRDEKKRKGERRGERVEEREGRGGSEDGEQGKEGRGKKKEGGGKGGMEEREGRGGRREGGAITCIQRKHVCLLHCWMRSHTVCSSAMSQWVMWSECNMLTCPSPQAPLRSATTASSSQLWHLAGSAWHSH